MQEFLLFFSKTLAERTKEGVKQTVEQEQNTGHVYTNTEGLACVVVCDKDYPQRVAFSLINRVLDSFQRVKKQEWYLRLTLGAQL